MAPLLRRHGMYTSHIEIQKSCDAAWHDAADPAGRRGLMRAGAQELAPTVGVVAACTALGVPRSSYYHAQRPARPAAPTPPRRRARQARSPTEEQTIRELLNFASIDAARAWMRWFTDWYNHEHKHSGIALLPPAVVHSGCAPAVIAKRQDPRAAASATHPERFPRGRPIAPQLPSQVGINLPRPSAAAPTAATPEPRPTASLRRRCRSWRAATHRRSGAGGSQLLGKSRWSTSSWRRHAQLARHLRIPR